MALFTVDPNNIFGKTVDEAGIYNVRVMASSNYQQSHTGKDMAVLDYEVLDGKYAGGPIRFNNIVWDNSTTDKQYLSITRFNTVLVAAGVPEGTPIDSIAAFVRGMVGKQLAVDTDWKQSQNGKYYLNVKGYRPLMQDGSKPNGVTRPQGGQAQVGNNPQQGGFQGAPNQGQGNGQETITDDDLPF